MDSILINIDKFGVQNVKPVLLFMCLCRLITAGVVTAVGALVATPFVLSAVGFTTAGITAGSYAAGMMSSAAAANGGAVAAGSTVAVLQSVGAAGLGAAGTVAIQN